MPTPLPTIEVYDESQVTPDLDLQIRRVLATCFPKDGDAFMITRAWHGSRPAVTILARDEQQDVVGHMDIHERTVDVGGVSVRVAGLQNVAILPGHRKTGLLARLMAVTIDEAARRKFDAGLLFCLPVLQRVYATVGWREMPGRQVVRVDEDGREAGLPNEDVPMFHPLRLLDMPPGVIHLRGNDW